MKSLLLLGCAALLVACGSSSGNYDGPAGSLSPGASDTAQPASDSVAPVDSQQPAVNDQQPTTGGTSTITCSQVAAAVVAKGCALTSQDIADCEQETAANAPCAAQWQGLLACYLSHFTCNDNGEATVMGNACDSVEQALGACLDGATITPEPGSNNCQSPTCDCADTCSLCQCEAVQIDIDCTPYCG